MGHPQLSFGCANLGISWTSKEELEKLAKALSKAEIRHVDTAARYPPHAPGLSERLLGDNTFPSKGFKINTKIMIKARDGAGSMTSDAIAQSLQNSLDALNTEKVSTLYCHGPDKQTPIAEQAAAIDAHYKEGKFDHFGVSNLDPKMLEEWLRIAEDQHYVKPTVYQGQYNLLCRGWEDTTIPILRKHGIKFCGFSPLAGGFLTGKLTFAGPDPEALVGTRFEQRDDNLPGKAARHWYDKPAMHAAMQKLKVSCERESITTTDASYRWVLYHSSLGEQDEMIFGATNTNQIDVLAQAVAAGPLPEILVGNIDHIYALCEDDAKSIIQY